MESNIRSKYFQKWKAKFCVIPESLVEIKILIKNTSQNKKTKFYRIIEVTDSMQNPSATAFSGQVFELPKNPLNAVVDSI